jgi:prepilin-type N-terminal cleavage/methylation domain-containing protein
MIIYKNKKGFTLIEVLLVITAIGILASIALVALNPNKQLEAGRAVKRKVDMDVIVKAIERYGVTNSGQYPPALESVVTGGTVGLCVTSPCTGGIDLTTDLAPYISAIPLPQTGQYTITKTATGITPGYDSSTIWATAGTTAPKLDLNFARDKQLVNAVNGSNPITFTRNSIGTYVGSDGLIKTAAANEPRFDHNPVTKESLGLLVEEGSTNFYNTSETLTNGRTGSSSGMVYTDFNTGGPQGGRFTRVVRDTSLSRSSDWDWEVNYSNTGLSLNQSLVVSFYARCPNGTLASIAVKNPDVGQTFNIDSTWRRFSVVFAYGGDYQTTPFFRINRGHTPAYANGATYDLAMLQIEANWYPTSHIPTTGSVVTRVAENVSIAGTNFNSFFNTSQGTFFADYNSKYPSNERMLNFGGGPTSTIISNEGVIGSGLYFSSIGNISGSAADGVKVAATTSVSESAGSFDGNTAVSTGASSYYAGANSLNFIAPAAAIKQNWIKRVTYWNTRLSNTILTNITK